MKPRIIYRIIDRDTGEAQSVYSRACRDEYDFSSPEEARHSNCWGIYRDRVKYKIVKYCVSYELIDDDDVDIK